MGTLRLIVPNSGNAFESLGLGNFLTPFRVKPFALFPLATDLLPAGESIGVDLCGGPPLVAVGSPTSGAKFSTLTGANYYRTAWDGSAAQAAGDGSGLTYVAVVKAPPNANPTLAPTTATHIMGNYDSTAPIEEGASLNHRTGTGQGNIQAIQSVSGGGTGQSGTNVVQTNADPYRADHWTFAALPVEDGEILRPWEGWSAYTPGEVAGNTGITTGDLGTAFPLTRAGTTGGTTAIARSGGQAIGIGGNPWSGNYSTSIGHFMFAAIWNRVLTSTEIAQVFADAKAWGESIGEVV